MRDLIKETPVNLPCYLGASLILHCLFLIVLPISNSRSEFTSFDPLSITLLKPIQSSTQSSELVDTDLGEERFISDERANKAVQALPAETRPFTTPSPTERSSSSKTIVPETLPRENFSSTQKYFFRSELSIPPVMLEEPFIELTEQKPKKSSISSTVKLRLFINSNGLIDHAQVISGTSSETLDAIVVTTFTPLRFSPGEINGQQVNSQVIYELDLDSLPEGFSQSGDQSQRLITPLSR